MDKKKKKLFRPKKEINSLEDERFPSEKFRIRFPFLRIRFRSFKEGGAPEIVGRSVVDRRTMSENN